MIGASVYRTKTPLLDLLARTDGGKLQLLDIQRGWVWDDDRIKSLLARVSVSFPIGGVMLLDKTDLCNCVINKTAISARTSRHIGNKAPSKHPPALEKAAIVEPERMDEILGSHCIAPEHLLIDRFYASRAEMLFQRIEAAS